MSNVGFVKYNRTERAKDLHGRPTENHVLNVIAFRISRTENLIKGLKSGECIVSDFANFGLKRQPMRTAIANLRKWGYITTRATKQATYASLCKTDVYDCNILEANQQINQQSTSKATNNQPAKQPAANHKQEVKKKEKKKRGKEKSPLPVQKPFDLEAARKTIEAKFGTGAELFRNLQAEQKKQTGVELTEQQISFAYVSFLQKGMVETYRGRIKGEYELFAKLFQWIGQQHRFDRLDQVTKEVPQWQNLEEYLEENCNGKDIALYRQNGKLKEWLDKFEQERFKLTNIAKAYENPNITAMLIFEVAYMPIGATLGGSKPDRKIESFQRFVDEQNDFLRKRGDIREILLSRKNK